MKKTKQTHARMSLNELTYFSILYWFVVSFRSKPIKIADFIEWILWVEWSEEQTKTTKKKTKWKKKKNNETAATSDAKNFVLAITFVNTNLLLCELSLDLCDSRLNVTALVLALEHQQMRLENARIIFLLLFFFLSRFLHVTWETARENGFVCRKRKDIISMINPTDFVWLSMWPNKSRSIDPEHKVVSGEENGGQQQSPSHAKIIKH